MKHLKPVITAFSVLMASNAIAKDLPVTGSNPTKLNPVIVTANPLGRSENDLTQPINILSGDELLQKSQLTIGETLSGELGIRSTYYGPNASRPVIRGLGDDQIQILQNGVSNIDASSVSADHNVAIDPLSAQRIEVVRGPAALLYGSRAVGGVVNVIDNRIPDELISEKITGQVDSRYNSANRERSGSLLLEGGLGNYAWHANGFKRSTDDLSIPGYARSKSLRAEEPLDEEAKNKLPNSQSRSEGGSVGVSKFFKKGYLGLALTNYDSNYGTVAEPDVTIEMKQKRLDLAGAYKDPLRGIKETKFKLGLSDYKHTEFEGGEAGTVFKNRGYDSRVEIVHNKFGLFEGALGLQSSLSDFSALGEEAFMPPTTTHNNSGFIFEEIHLDKLCLQLGGRFDYQTVNADTTQNFTNLDSRNDLTKSGSAGFIYRPKKGYAVALSSSYTERAPNSQELYANGPHIATNAFEIGNRDLNIQKSTGLDLSFRKENGLVKGEVNFFYNRFRNFITLVANGENDPDNNLPIYNFLNLPAEFYGAEAKADFTAYNVNSHKIGFELRSDYVEARNSKTHEPLPRIAPLRIGGSAIYKYQKIGLRLDTDYTFAQNHVSQSERKTEGYTMVNTDVDYAFNIGSTYSKLYLKATNLLDQEARSHVSFLKDIAPLPGRSFIVGIRSAF